MSVSDKGRNAALFLVLPLAVQLVVFKLIKFAILSGAAETARAVPQSNLISHMLVEHASAPALVVSVSVFLLAIIVSQFSLSGTGATFLGISLWAVISASASRLLPGSEVWLDQQFYDTIRWDLLIALSLALATMLAVDRLRRRYRYPAITILHLVVLIMMVLASLDFGYFVMTGSLADSYMLRYAFTNIDNLSYVFVHELSGTRLMLLALPLVLVGWSYIYSLGARRLAPKSTLPMALVCLSALALVLLPARDRDAATAMLVRPAISDLISTVAYGAEAEDATLDIESARVPIFDAANLRLDGAARRPNVVFIILESQRHPDHLKQGLHFSPTPFLDRLSPKSVVVEQMYAVVPHTNKALVPILCGVFPRISQGDETEVPARCLPKLLGDLGYGSAFFTPATLVFERKDELLDSMGFDESYGDGDYNRIGFERVNYFGHEETIMLSQSMAWVDEHAERGQPFLATFLSVTPHHPYSTPNHFPTRSFGDDRPDYNQYLNAIAYVDNFVEKLMRKFDQRGLLESTVFVIVGDHGEAFGEHGLRFHSAVPYDEVLKVPALLYAPGRLEGGSTVTGPRQQIDLVPTIAELMEARFAEGQIPGRSLLGERPDRRLYHAGWIENQSMAVRDGGRKYVYHFGRKPIEVFDLETDPYETDPVTLDPESQESRELAAELYLWRARVNAAYRDVH
ncbi:MAG: LTA synthase family protein [Rhodothermia bacterium]|nr:LTA synthase family protein [Rhodothermia bacterium]